MCNLAYQFEGWATTFYGPFVRAELKVESVRIPIRVVRVFFYFQNSTGNSQLSFSTCAHNLAHKFEWPLGSFCSSSTTYFSDGLAQKPVNFFGWKYLSSPTPSQPLTSTQLSPTGLIQMEFDNDTSKLYRTKVYPDIPSAEEKKQKPRDRHKPYAPRGGNGAVGSRRANTAFGTIIAQIEALLRAHLHGSIYSETPFPAETLGFLVVR
ncbi:uncharacterized protein LACBIDRAFT_324845 [Laccaria bicolor S238N-H82]|uniref:Predicted protein n=1 Tax=Laccaria bicolor (strain S238N-H82 / ATCC MYA-4686) TaxID=486041 RepID=B0D384_LACBS|nr:uncharacterized protein LACBIDRAFT_324845 [Laccaria bicolor S238N-H82]EDR10870.1 predicted protein [Laccaria bicolor S238N-H82]|eukprot:XP_001878171.1 predicted protein [Laccaria bicolor S238N-H82]